MKEYEVIHEIPNSCSGNQMRDVFFHEIECESPAEWVRSRHPEDHYDLEEDVQADGSIIIYVTVKGLINKYIFTEI